MELHDVSQRIRTFTRFEVCRHGALEALWLPGVFSLTVWLAIGTSSLLAQTSDDPTPDLVSALHHRLPKVQKAAFEALLTQAQRGRDVSHAREALLEFANLQHDGEDYESQAAALKVLVTIDQDIAAKVVQRADVLVGGFESLIAQKDSSRELSYALTGHLDRAFRVLHCVTLPEHVRQASEMARRVLKAKNDPYRYELLLPLIYKACPTAGECVEATRKLQLEPHARQVHGHLLTEIYHADIDREGLAFLTRLPVGSDTDPAAQAYLLGLLAPRSEEAKRAALEFMNDKYELRNVRRAAASGLLAGLTPEGEIYWQADAVCDELGDYQRLLAIGPELDRDAHQDLKQARITKEKPPKESDVQPPARETPAENHPPEQPQVTREDSERFLKAFLPIRSRLRSEVVGGRIIPHVPHDVFSELREASTEARRNGHPGTAHLLDETIESWQLSVTQGTMVIVAE